MKTISRTQRNLYAVTLGLLVGTPASAITISDTPLFVTAAVDPNVMLLIDTSGSMNNIIWADGFDPAVNYEDWSSGDNNYYSSSGNNHLHNIDVSHNGSVNCGTNGRWVRGDSGGVTKYLCLPANSVVGGETRYTGKYLNFLFQTYADHSDLTSVIPTNIRMEVAKNAAKDLVDQTDNVRFGTASFYGPSSKSYGHGATIDAGCGSTLATVKSKIDTYSASTNTPLAESLYEITRYYRGLSSYYHSNTYYSSPIQYRCQHNFTIAITDGLPTRDTTFPSNDPADTADGSASLPNWDNKAPATSQSDYPNFPQYSDGFQANGGSSGSEGYSLYLDDIAKFGFDIDFKTSGTDNAGGSYQDPDFPTQNMETYTIGFSIAMQMLEDAAEYGNGLYFTASNASQLTKALSEAIADAKFKGEAAAAAVATNSTRLDTNTTIYQARFDSRDWSGDLLAFSLDDASGDVLTTEDWSVRDRLPPSASATVSAASRNIYTFDPDNDTGIEFQWPSDYTSPVSGTDLTSSMIQDLLSNAPHAANTTNSGEIGENQTYGAELVAYLRGDTSTSGTYNGAFRSRNSVLGDIVNSNPAFVGTRDFGYKTLPDPEGEDYLTFRSSTAYKNRIPMLYVGANDGMLHAFNADNGNELFAYVPSTVFPNLDQLAASDYSHQFYVNGSPRAGDAYLSGAWKTVLIGSTGAGGRGIFALDVTTPGSFSAGNLMWELTASDDGDLGYVLGQPTIARLPDGTWAGIIGNGYNSDNEHAVLFIVDLADGSILKKLDTGVGSAASPNGLAAPIPVDTDGDRITDTIYAGDLLGNMWKFDVSSASSATWKIAYESGGTPKPLFTALDSDGNPQPITVRPDIGAHPKGGVMVYFGTGTFFQTGDNIIGNNPDVNSFYGIRDNGTRLTGGRGNLQEQTIDAELYDVGFGSNTFDVRVVSDEVVNYQVVDGWYLDLVSPVNGAEGERVIVDPLLRNGRIIFSTLIPNVDPCGYGGKGWLMEMASVSGSRFAFSVFDLNGDGEFTAADFASVSGNDFSVSGRRFNEIISQPVVIDAGEREHKYVSGSSGGIGHITEKGDGKKGRQSWRQIR